MKRKTQRKRECVNDHSKQYERFRLNSNCSTYSMRMNCSTPKFGPELWIALDSHYGSLLVWNCQYLHFWSDLFHNSSMEHAHTHTHRLRQSSKYYWLSKLGLWVLLVKQEPNSIGIKINAEWNPFVDWENEKKVSVKIIQSLRLVMTSNDVIRRNWNVFSITHFRYNRLMSSSQKARAHSNCIAFSQRARETVKERETEKKRMKSFLLIISLLLFLFSPRASPYSNRSWIFLDSGKTCIDATQ